MPDLIVAVAGHRGVGKTATVENLERQYGFTGVSPDQVIADFASRRGIRVGTDPGEWSEMRQQITRAHGPDWLTHTLCEMPAARVALDGLQTVGDLDAFCRADAHGKVRVALAGLTCPAAVRYQRLAGGADLDPAVLGGFFALEHRQYYSDRPHEVAIQAVLDLVPEVFRIDTETIPPEAVGRLLVSKLVAADYLPAFWQ